MNRWLWVLENVLFPVLLITSWAFSRTVFNDLFHNMSGVEYIGLGALALHSVVQLRDLLAYVSKKTTRRTPPLNAEFLLYLFLSKPDSEAVAGDLEERWRTIKKRFGKRHADFWYCFQVLRSIAPFGWAALKRVSGLLALIETWRRIRG